MTSQPPPPSTPPNSAPAATGTLATWGSRFLAYLIDYALVGVPLAIVAVVTGAMTTATLDPATGEMSGGGGAVGILAVVWLAAVAFQFWNVGWKQGTTGQSIGKGVLNIAVVREQGGYMGGGLGIGRMLLHGFLGGLCLLNYLWPLWDDENQTWTDMIVNTVVVDA